MKFSLERIGARLRKHGILYLVLAIQFAIGITFIVYALNHIYSLKERKQILETQMDYNTISVTAYDKGSDANLDEAPITYGDYEMIQEMTEGNTVFYIYKFNEFINQGEFIQVPVLYTNIGGTGDDEKIAYYGKGIAEKVKADMDSDISFFRLEQGELILKEEESVYSLQPFPQQGESITITRDLTIPDIKAEDCILLPIEAYTRFAPEDFTILQIQTSGLEDSEQVINKVELYLKEQHGEQYVYEFKNFLNTYESSSASLIELSQYYGRMAIIMLAILLVGFTGVVRIFMKQRELELAVCTALGAGKVRLCTELFIEVLCICGVGCFLGLVVGGILTTRTTIAVFSLRQQGEAVLIGILVTLVSTGIITYPSMRRVIHMRPDELLRAL